MTNESRDLHITTDANILGGTPVVAGTRITVYAVLQRLRDRNTTDHLVDGCPEVPHEAIKAAASLDLLALLPSRTVPTINGMTSGFSTLVGSQSSCAATDSIPAIHENADVWPPSSSTV